MNINDVRKILLLGAGTMGQQISVPCSLAGYDVVIYDINEGSLKMQWRRFSTFSAGLYCRQNVRRNRQMQP